MESIKQVLITRDGMTEAEAQKAVDEMTEDFFDRLGNGDMPYDICGEYFGLEPDYLEELI